MSKLKKLNQTLDVKKPGFENDVIRSVVLTLVDDWKTIDQDRISIKAVSGGITNNLYTAFILDAADFKVSQVLIRVYGNKTELIIDRQRELQNIQRLYPKGFGPKIYGIFDNGYIYEYYKGRCLSPEELHSCAWNERLGNALAEWHKQEVQGERKSTVWNTIFHWLTLVPESYGSERDHKFKQWPVARIKKELKELQVELEKLNSPVVFSHNDLLAGNIIVDEATQTIKFIDFEYADTNYRAFDIANHFNEWAGFEADYTRYPTKDQQYQFYRPYLSEVNGVEPTEELLHQLYVEVNKFALLSHFFWGVWSLVQARISNIDFDFLEYAVLRFDEYYTKKNEFLSLS